MVTTTRVIKAVSFDLWGTLYEGGRSSEDSAHPKRVETISTCLRTHGVRCADSTIAEACRESGDLFLKKWLERQELFTNYDRIRWILAKFSVFLNDHDTEMLVRQYEDIDPATWPTLKVGAAALIMWTSERVPTVIISDTANMSGRMLRAVLKRDRLLDVFAETFFSDEVGYPKPRQELFQAAVTFLKIAPGNLLHVGDRVATDGLGASRCGAKFAYVGSRDPSSEVQRVSNYVCSNLAELHALLCSLLTREA